MMVVNRICFIFLMMLLSACSRQSNTSKQHIMTVEPQISTNTLFYSGTIQPLKTMIIPSPTDGVILDMPFQYGESVKAGQLLFVLSSTKFLTDYKTALMQYIKAKSDFNTSKAQLDEAEFLHKNKLISDDDYKSKQTGFYGNQLALLQAKDTLDNLVHQSGMNNWAIDQLTIADIDKITNALHLQRNSETLHILSPADGIILFSNKGEDENKKMMKGDTIKQGDVLAMVGDMSGLSVHIKVNELTVNQLHVDQKVKITGIAFPGIILDGKINRIDHQGEATNGSVPVFSVEVIVPLLTAMQQKMIHVGMSVTSQIDITDAAKIMVPIVAINEKNGSSYVNLYDEKKRTTQEVVVNTGKTTMDSVAILSGLQTGDRIVLPG